MIIIFNFAVEEIVETIKENLLYIGVEFN